jgi:molybdopterin converting factor small subunit
MRIRLVFLALYRDLVGAAETSVDVPSGATAHDVVRVLRAGGPPWGRLPEAPVVARNLEYVTLDAVLADGDELALLPPVSGG